MIKQLKSNKGFTLIELLVVISIIGILTTLITANLTAAQARARDGRRKTDLKAIATGLEFYYNDNYVYPARGTTQGTFDIVSGTQLQAPSPGTNIYIKTIPKDPKSATQQYHYCVSATKKTYNLYALLENANDGDRYCGSNTSTWSGTSCGVNNSGCDAAGGWNRSDANANFTVKEPD
jgi:general secretion pathway protein G